MTQSTTLIEYEGDYEERALERIPSRYRDADNLEDLIAAIAEQAQVLEDVAFDLLVSARLDAATGESLDQWAGLVGLDRRSATDSELRRYVRAQIQVNAAEGTVEDLLEIWRTLTAPSTVRHRAHYPAGFRLTAYRSDWMRPNRARRVGRIIRRAKPAGKAMSLVETITDESVAGTGQEFARSI